MFLIVYHMKKLPFLICQSMCDPVVKSKKLCFKLINGTLVIRRTIWDKPYKSVVLGSNPVKN